MILAFFVPFRLSSLSMAEAPVAILPYVLEAVRLASHAGIFRGARISSLPTWGGKKYENACVGGYRSPGCNTSFELPLYSVGRFQTGFHGGYHSPFHFHSVCRFGLFHSVRRFQLLWHVSPSRWFFSACVAFQLAISGVNRFH